MVVATKFLPRTPEEIEKGVTGQQHIENMINTSLQNLGIMVSQIGTVVSNSEYAKLLGIEPVLKKEQIILRLLCLEVSIVTI